MKSVTAPNFNNSVLELKDTLPLDKSLALNVQPPIAPAVEVILPVKNTFSLNNPNPGLEPTNVVEIPDKSPSLAFKSTS